MLAFMIIGAVAFGVYIYFSIGPSQLSAEIYRVDTANFLFYFALSFFSMLLVMFLWSTAWYTLLKALSINLGLKKTFLYYMAGEFVDRIVPSPGVVGEAARAFFLNKDTQSTYGVIMAAGITNRIVSYGVVASGLSIGIAYLFITQTIPSFVLGLLVLIWVGAVALLFLLSFLSLSEAATGKIVSALVKLLRGMRIKKTDSFSVSANKFLARFHYNFKYFSAKPHLLILPVILNIVAYTLDFGVYALAFRALGLTQLPLGFLIVIYLLAGAIQDGAASLSVGGLEIFLTNIFILYGIPAAASGIAAVTLRSVIFYFPLILGYVFVQAIGAKKMFNSKNYNEVEQKQ